MIEIILHSRLLHHWDQQNYIHAVTTLYGMAIVRDNLGLAIGKVWMNHIKIGALPWVNI